MADNTKFIKTKDERTANALKSKGFAVLDYDGGTWTFMDNGIRNFSDGVDPKTLMYTNKMDV